MGGNAAEKFCGNYDDLHVLAVGFAVLELLLLWALALWVLALEVLALEVMALEVMALVMLMGGSLPCAPKNQFLSLTYEEYKNVLDSILNANYWCECLEQLQLTWPFLLLGGLSL